MLLDIEKMIILKSVTIFAEAEEQVLADVVRVIEEEQYEPGQVVFRKGDLGTCMYIIAGGRVKVHDGDRVLNELGERMIFGELAAIDPEPRSASITAIEETTLLKLSQMALFELISERFEITEGIFRFLCRAIRERNLHSA